jgi:hypothetical protein
MDVLLAEDLGAKSKGMMVGIGMKFDALNPHQEVTFDWKGLQEIGLGTLSLK